MKNTEFEQVKFIIKLIKEELTSPFHDLRKEKRPLNSEEIFKLLIGNDNLQKGMITVAKVMKINNDLHIKCK